VAAKLLIVVGDCPSCTLLDETMDDMHVGVLVFFVKAIMVLHRHPLNWPNF